MSNYAENVVAKNIDSIDNISREELINILFFSGMLVKEDSSREKELSGVVELARKWGIDVEEKLGITKDTDLSKIDRRHFRRNMNMRDIFDQEVDLAATFEFFERDNINYIFSKYREDMEEFDFTKEETDKMTYTSLDFSNQFTNKDISNAELLANTMYLSNQLAHIWNGIDNIGEKQASEGLVNVFQSLMKIKVHCIKELIKEKRNGAKLEINIRKDPKIKGKNNDMAIIALPDYFEPFIIHFDASMLSTQAMNLCKDEELFFSKGYINSMPTKLTDEKKELFSRLHSQYYYKRAYTNRKTDRLSWYMDTQKRLNNITRGNIRGPKKQENERKTYSTRNLKALKNGEKVASTNMKNEQEKADSTNTENRQENVDSTNVQNAPDGISNGINNEIRNEAIGYETTEIGELLELRETLLRNINLAKSILRESKSRLREVEEEMQEKGISPEKNKEQEK